MLLLRYFPLLQTQEGAGVVQFRQKISVGVGEFLQGKFGGGVLGGEGAEEFRVAVVVVLAGELGLGLG